MLIPNYADRSAEFFIGKKSAFQLLDGRIIITYVNPYRHADGELTTDVHIAISLPQSSNVFCGRLPKPMQISFTIIQYLYYA